uniref:WW domain-containing protein n=1 Tax=Mucochytrium quahogii TaxID=96639 RepID=A0A7S2RM09_9STRA
MEEDEEEEEEESESEDEDDDDATRAARKLKKLEKKKKQQILSELNKELDSIGSKHKKGDLQAEAMHLIEKVQKVLAPFEYTEEETKDALENFEDAYGKVAIDDQPANFRRCRCMENGHRRVCVPPDPEFRCERKALFIKIRLTTHMEKIKRDSLNREQEALEERLAVVEAQTREFCGTREGVIFFKNLAHDQAHILLEFERKEKYVLKKQLKLKRQKAYEERSRYKRREKLIQSRQLRIKRLEKQKRKLLAKLDRCQGWEAKECKDQILDIDDELENHPQDIELEIIETDQEIADAKFRKKAKPKQILSRYTPLGTIEESLLELTTKRVKKRSAIVFYKLIEAYVEAERRRVGLEIRDEFRITRKIMYNWMNLNVKMTFFAWRVMARRQIYWRRHFEIEEESQRMLDDQAAEVDAFYKQLERDKWEEFVDPFSDKTFWKHNETQEVVWVEPQLQDMIFVPRFRLLKTN